MNWAYFIIGIIIAIVIIGIGLSILGSVDIGEDLCATTSLVPGCDQNV